jgi:ketosteroid isomerase-like protein
MSDTTPEVITRYLSAAAARNNAGLADCFTEDGTVLDEGNTYRGRDEIIGWREAIDGQWTYTTNVTGTEAAGDNEYRVFIHLEGDFPGGVVDLMQEYVLAGDLIAHLKIAE